MRSDQVGKVRILAVFPLDVGRQATRGLVEKASDLVATARALGFEVDAVLCEGKSLHWAGSQDAKSMSNRSAYFRWQGMYSGLTQQLLSSYDVLWLRAMPSSSAQIKCLQRAKKCGLTTILDIPTYPSVWEAQSLVRRGILRFASLFDKYRATVVDRVVTTSNHGSIWGRPTLKVQNGVRVIECERVAADYRGNEIAILVVGVAQWAAWHGLQRLLQGIVEAQLQRDFCFEFAGEGPAVANLSAYAKQAGLQVIWRGPLHGAERDDLLARGDIAVGTLSFAGNQLTHYYPLKHRVYAAAGIPFLATARDPVWNDCPAVYQIVDDSGSVDGPKFLEFTQRARANRAAWQTMLRTEAKKHSWENTYSELWSYLNQLKPEA